MANSYDRAKSRKNIDNFSFWSFLREHGLIKTTIFYTEFSPLEKSVSPMGKLEKRFKVGVSTARKEKVGRCENDWRRVEQCPLSEIL